ncbi:MAG: hypothetical protein J6U54_05745 [Clostridiales bacterium]|nr:hypothetical protein [Clostridiales bacterium]
MQIRCDKCGKPITNSMFNINGVTLCGECAREAGLIDNFMPSTLKFLDQEFSGFIPPIMREQLEFSPTRSQIKCPKCGTSLKEFESTGSLGCIECYNTFNESIMRLLMRLQANTHYRGRAPGIASESIPTSKDEKVVDLPTINVEEEASSEVQEKDNNMDAGKLLKYSNADLGMLTNDDLKEAIKLAVASEDYILAAKFRDELKSREDV